VSISNLLDIPRDMPAKARHARLNLGHFGIERGQNRIERRRGDRRQAWASARGGNQA
jgi:hypothetical protein